LLKKNASNLECTIINTKISSSEKIIYVAVEPPSIRSIELFFYSNYQNIFEHVFGFIYKREYKDGNFYLQLKIPYIYHFLIADNFLDEPLYSPVYCYYHTFLSLEKCDLKNIKTFNKFFINPLTCFLSALYDSDHKILQAINAQFFNCICLDTMRFYESDFTTKTKNIPTFMKKIIDYYWFSTITPLLSYTNLSPKTNIKEFTNYPGCLLIMGKENIPPYFNIFYWDFITRKYGYSADDKLFKNVAFLDFDNIVKTCGSCTTPLIPEGYEEADEYDDTYADDIDNSEYS